MARYSAGRPHPVSAGSRPTHAGHLHATALKPTALQALPLTPLEPLPEGMVPDGMVTYVTLKGRVRSCTLTELMTLDPGALMPVRLVFTGEPGDKERTVQGTRRAPNYRGQRSIGGSMTVVRVGRRLPYSSGLERLRLQYADLDPSTIGAVTQPFAMLFRYGGAEALHIPDLLLRRRGRPRLLVDVRPWALQHDPRSQLAFALTRAAALAAGLDYEVWGEPPATEAYNVCFLSGYRLEPTGFAAAAAELVPLVLRAPYTIAELTAACSSPRHFIRPALFHLLWRGDLAIDLTRPLRETTEVTPGPLTPAAGRP